MAIWKKTLTTSPEDIDSYYDRKHAEMDEQVGPKLQELKDEVELINKELTKMNDYLIHVDESINILMPFCYIIEDGEYPKILRWEKFNKEWFICVDNLQVGLKPLRDCGLATRIEYIQYIPKFLEEFTKEIKSKREDTNNLLSKIMCKFDQD